MIKKNRVSPVIAAPPVLSLKSTEQTELPTAETVNAAAAELTGQKPKTVTEKKVKVKAPVGRPVKKEAVGRVKFTTMLPKTMIRYLKIRAVEHDITAADFIVEIIDEYMKKERRKP